jgi:hypothetical protein
MKPRDYHKLAIIRREARGNTTYVPSKKLYKRKPKHRKKVSW